MCRQWHLPLVTHTRNSESKLRPRFTSVTFWSRVTAVNHTGGTISLIMRKVLIAISNSATISSEGLIAELHNVWSY